MSYLERNHLAVFFPPVEGDYFQLCLNKKALQVDLITKGTRNALFIGAHPILIFAWDYQPGSKVWYAPNMHWGLANKDVQHGFAEPAFKEWFWIQTQLSLPFILSPLFSLSCKTWSQRTCFQEEPCSLTGVLTIPTYQCAFQAIIQLFADNSVVCTQVALMWRKQWDGGPWRGAKFDLKLIMSGGAWSGISLRSVRGSMYVARERNVGRRQRLCWNLFSSLLA